MLLPQRTDRYILGPWIESAGIKPGPMPSHWKDVDPMVRGVWEMAQTIEQESLVDVRQPWLVDFVAKKKQSEAHTSHGDTWHTKGSSLDEYFYADGFGGLKYGILHARRLLQREEPTYVDWLADASAVRSANVMAENGLGKGISIGLGPDTGATYGGRIRHIEGSVLDPTVQAKYLEALSSKKIDLFTARPKGGMELLPTSHASVGLYYYHRLARSVYNRMSPGGLMFFQTPYMGADQVKWSTTMERWIENLQRHDINADYNGEAAVIEKSAEPGPLPSLSKEMLKRHVMEYCGSLDLSTVGFPDI